MSRVVQFNSTDAIREQASLWMVRLQEGLTLDQEQQLDEWLAESSAHSAQLLELAEIWDEMEVLRELKPLFEGVQSKPKHASSRKQQRPAMLPWAAAAGIVVIVSLGIMLAPVLDRASVQQSAVATSETKQLEIATEQFYSSQIGEFIEIPLRDGSLVTLNSNSSISVEFKDHSRDIVLHQGEAHFDVYKDPQRPLSVLAAGRMVEAVGTAFSVKKTDGSVVVAVNEGKVAVYDAAVPKVEPTPAVDSLRAGDVLTITDDDKDVRAILTSQRWRIAWPGARE